MSRDISHYNMPEFLEGHVWLVGAGPGDPGLVTLLGAHALREADTVVYDALVSPEILELANPDAELKQAIEDSVIKFGHTILEDEVLSTKINGWAEDSGRYLIRTYGHEVADLISGTIDDWDPEATSERIELQIGKDLQFIRINGTVIGGLAGLLIHTFTVVPGLLGINFFN